MRGTVVTRQTALHGLARLRTGDKNLFTRARPAITQLASPQAQSLGRHRHLPTPHRPHPHPARSPRGNRHLYIINTAATRHAHSASATPWRVLNPTAWAPALRDVAEEAHLL
jgi:hypothetical protein